jgi:(E)-4-hydroxy-3-methylbut-2-enyl-diphosphate synthase
VAYPRRRRLHHRRPPSAVVQSMITCDTMDTARLRPANPSIWSLPAANRPHHRPHRQGRRQPQNIVAELRQQDCHVPIVADIHFKPEAASKPPAGSKKSASTPATTPTRSGSPSRNTPTKNTMPNCCGSRNSSPPGQTLPSARPRPAHRHQPRLAQRPHPQPLRRHPAGMVESALEFARIARKHTISTTSCSR